MDKHIDFFNYEGCLIYYKGKINSLNQAKMYGEKSLAKPILLIAVIDSITEDELVENRIVLTEKLIVRYEKLMKVYSKDLKYYSHTPISNPFWHLQSDGFWHLYGESCIDIQTNTPSISWIKEHVRYSKLDESLWIMLQNKEYRSKLREYIVDYKLKDGTWSGGKVFEGLGTLAALLLIA